MWILKLCLWKWYVELYTDSTPLRPGEYIWFDKDEAESEAERLNHQYWVEISA